MGPIEQYYNKTDGNDSVPFITIGVVKNVNDPQQMGRVQVLLPSLGEDSTHANMDQLPWASYVSPFGGADEKMSRGVGQEGQNKDSPYGSTTSGFVSYGFWNIPQLGSRVVVFCVDNDPNQLYYFGSPFSNSTTHTMPHGRYLTDVPGGEQGPEGPLSSTEQPIQPLYNNTIKAFGSHVNFEWRSRGADRSVSAISPNRIVPISNDNNENHTGVVTKKLDDRDVTIVEEDGNILGKDLLHRQGYALSKIDPKKVTDDTYHIERNKETDKNLQSTVYSWTTPGFHAISMDDRPENCRARFRTSSGHQILLDDTNERIYISSSEGRNWVEMDADGHIYIFSEESISMRAKGDLNLTAEKTVRIKGNEGVHIQTPKEFRVHAVEDIHIRGEKDMFTTIDNDHHVHIKAKNYTTIDGTSNVHIVGAVNVSYDSTFDFTVGGVGKVTIVGDTHLHTNANLRIKSDANTLIEAANISNNSSNFVVDPAGNLKITNSLNTGADIVSGGNVKASNGQDLAGLKGHTHLYNPGPLPPAQTVGFTSSGGSASSSPAAWGGSDAVDAVDSMDAELAFWTNIIPDHEPWARTYIANAVENIDHTPELEYTNPAVGRSMKRSDVENDRKRNPLWHR